MLRDTVRAFVAAEVEPQALEHDRAERFNLPLFRKLGSMGLLGVTRIDQLGPAYVCKAEPVVHPHEMSAWINMPEGRIL